MCSQKTHSGHISVWFCQVVYRMIWKSSIVNGNDIRSSLKTGQAGARKNCPRYHCSCLSIFFCTVLLQWSWQTQPVTTLLCALKGQTSAPFNLGWRFPFRIFLDRNRPIKTVNESKSTWLAYVCLRWVIIASAAILVLSLFNHVWQKFICPGRAGPVFRHDRKTRSLPPRPSQFAQTQTHNFLLERVCRCSQY